MLAQSGLNYGHDHEINNRLVKVRYYEEFIIKNCYSDLEIVLVFDLYNCALNPRYTPFCAPKNILQLSSCIIPLFKKGDPLNPENYRPIANLLHVVKWSSFLVSE